MYFVFDVELITLFFPFCAAHDIGVGHKPVSVPNVPRHESLCGEGRTGHSLRLVLSSDTQVSILPHSLLFFFSFSFSLCFPPNPVTHILLVSSSCSGSTHSGHYTAYIRDIDCLGTWADPVCLYCLSYQLWSIDDASVGFLKGVEPVKLQPPARQSSTLSSDPIEFSSPTDLLVALLYQLDGQANLNKLCKVGKLVQVCTLNPSTCKQLAHSQKLCCHPLIGRGIRSLLIGHFVHRSRQMMLVFAEKSLAHNGPVY